jgi:uncharacterized protein YbjT (DUF2867 family)
VTRTVLVTGGAGYFGTVLVDRALARGDRVRVLDLHAPAPREGVEVVVADVRDREAVTDACAGVDVLLHNVAQVPLAKDRDLFESVNVLGTANVLLAAREQRVAKVVHTSSSAVFGIPEHNPVTEDSPGRPLEAYGRAKLEAEALCREAAGAGDVAGDRVLQLAEHVHRLLVATRRLQRAVGPLGDDADGARDADRGGAARRKALEVERPPDRTEDVDHGVRLAVGDPVGATGRRWRRLGQQQGLDQVAGVDHRPPVRSVAEQGEASTAHRRQPLGLAGGLERPVEPGRAEHDGLDVTALVMSPMKVRSAEKWRMFSTPRASTA